MGHVKIIQSGSLIEIYQYTRDYVPPKKRKRESYKQLKKNRPRRADSIRRATKSFRRLVRANLDTAQSVTLVTLTMYSIVPLKTSRQYLTRYLAKLTRECHKLNHEIKYIVVPEWQKRGAVHYHAIIWNLPKEISHNERTTRYLSRLWTLGFCDSTPTDGHVKLASYLTKYMRKSMQDIRLSGEKAYHASRNLVRPVSISSHFLMENKALLVGTDSPRHTHNFRTQWLGNCTYETYSLDNPIKKSILNE